MSIVREGRGKRGEWCVIPLGDGLSPVPHKRGIFCRVLTGNQYHTIVDYLIAGVGAMGRASKHLDYPEWAPARRILPELRKRVLEDLVQMGRWVNTYEQITSLW